MTAKLQTSVQTISFAQFLEWKPADLRCELYDGVVVEMQPTGRHEEIAEFLNTELAIAARRHQLPLRFPQRALIKAPNKETGYQPDVMLINREALAQEPMWEKAATLTKGSSIALVIEVVSTNWRDDYVYKLTDYELLQISEYWIVDYLALGGRRYIGNPKLPTISVYQLVDGEYQLQVFHGSERIVSSLFPDLTLTPTQIFQA